MATLRESNHNNKRKLNESEEAPNLMPSKRRKIHKLSSEQLVSQLGDVFDEIEQPCDLTIGGKSKTLPLIPGLHVNDIGHIPLPISDIQLKSLLSKCAKSSFGRGLKTQNDENVRKSLELTPEQFCFKNPEWNAKINRLVNHVAIKLGCNEDCVQYVKAYVYKLLIYEKNGHFVEHRDTQKKNGMFATLVVQLPSKYCVIDNKPVLTVTHKNNVKKYYFGTNKTDNDNCAYNIYYSAHYVDLTHKINTIKDGIRMAVIYNICWEGPKNIMPQVSNIDKISENINNILNNWNPEQQYPIAINLEHFYTDKELSQNGINALKGSDFAKLYSLQQAESAQQMKLQIFIAQVQRSVEESGSGGGGYGYRYDDYDCCDWEEIDRSECVTNEWYSSNGKKFKFGKFIEIDLKNHCIGYDEDESDQEWEQIDQTQEGYLGNEGATQSTTYAKYIAIFFRKQNQFQLMLNGEHGIEGGIEWVKYMISKKIKYDISAEIGIIMDAFIGNEENKKYTQSLLSILFKANNFHLMSELINKGLVPYGIGLHYNGNYNRYQYHSMYGSLRSEHIDSNSISTIIANSIVGFGWNEPLKPAVLKLIDCMQSDKCTHNDIVKYMSVLKLLKDKNYYHCKYEEIYNAVDGSFLIKKLKVTHFISKQIAEYASDNCFEDISMKIWENVVNKLQLNNMAVPKVALAAPTIVTILQFIQSCDWDEQKQQGMFDMFLKSYSQAPNIPRVLELWIQHINSLQNNISPEIKILMKLFKPNTCLKLIPSIIRILMKMNDLSTIISFINEKLIAQNIGLHQFHYNAIIIIVDLITTFGWQEPMSSTLMKLVNSQMTNRCAAQNINNYCSLVKSLQQRMNTQQTDSDYSQSDDDIVILNNNQNKNKNKNQNGNMNYKDLSVCLQEISSAVWQNMVKKLDLNGGGVAMKRMDKNSVIYILELMIICEDAWSSEYKKDIFKVFGDAYGLHINQKMQYEIIKYIQSSMKNKMHMECIQTVIKERIKYLSNIEKPQFSWKMLEYGGRRISDKKLDTFLKSNNEQLTVRGFGGIGQARKYAAESTGARWRRSSCTNVYTCSTDFYSIKCEAQGIGKSAYVTIKKSKDYFNGKMRKYNARMTELKLLFSFLND